MFLKAADLTAKAYIIPGLGIIIDFPGDLYMLPYINRWFVYYLVLFKGLYDIREIMQKVT